jgi:magnesium-transporting ATPase (P-type)
MFNALNALSDESSILTVGLFANPALIYAILLSVFLHCLICYIPFFARIFGTRPLLLNDWLLVLAFTFPVIIIDEVIKVFVRARTARALEERRKSSHDKKQ